MTALVNRGDGPEGDVCSEVAIAATPTQAVTAVCSNGTLKLIRWGLSPDPADPSKLKITLGGSASDQAATKIAMMQHVLVNSPAVTRLVVAARDIQGKLRLTTWRASEAPPAGNHEVEFIGAFPDSASLPIHIGPINSVALVSLGPERYATAVEMEDGTLRLDTWMITSVGWIGHISTHTRGKIVGGVSMDLVASSEFVTAVRTHDGGNLDLIKCHFSLDGTITQVTKKLTDISISKVVVTFGFLPNDFTLTPTHSQIVTASRSEAGLLMVDAWEIRDSMMNVGQISTAPTDHLAIANTNNHVVTASRDSTAPHRLRLTRWELAPVLANKGETSGEPVGEGVAIAAIGENYWLTAVCDSSGKLQVSAWS